MGALGHTRLLLQPFIIVLAVAALHLLFSSNTVTAGIIVPILVALADDLGVERVGHSSTRRIHIFAGLHPRQRGADDHHPVFVGLLLDRDMARAGVAMTAGAAACVAVSVGVNHGSGGDDGAAASHDTDEGARGAARRVPRSP